MDALHGYFQVALDEEASKLTTFLLPSGRYRYLRLPMGLSSSSDEWCMHTDRAIEGLPWACKIVDDILVWAPSFTELLDRIRIIAKRCLSLNIVLSKSKLKIGEEVPFAGLIVGPTGVRPDPSRLEAIANFPTPTDTTGVRSFLGLANQLSGFVPDYAHMSRNLRGLTGKGAAFIWLPEHEEEFSQMKKVLSGSLCVSHFRPDLPAILLTDASRLHGLGFAMGHIIDDKFKVVVCGSKSLTGTQERYATIELECLAVVYAIQKCEFYLKGLQSFQVLTDHKPLEGVFKKDLLDLSNPRLLRMREKIMEYSFEVKWLMRYPGPLSLLQKKTKIWPLIQPERASHQQGLMIYVRY